MLIPGQSIKQMFALLALDTTVEKMKIVSCRTQLQHVSLCRVGVTATTGGCYSNDRWVL